MKKFMKDNPVCFQNNYLEHGVPILSKIIIISVIIPMKLS